MTIYLYTGNGAGKTTNALGIALRAMGHDKHVLMIQFLKWNKNIGEYQIQWKGSSVWLPDHLEVHQFGREGWHGYKNITEEDNYLCLKAIDFTLDLLSGKKGKKDFNILILDELNLVAYLKIINMKTILEFLNIITSKYPDLDIVITGRYAPKKLIDRAEVVNKIIEVKSPKKFICKEGIQY
jgi:cob(I)alamin adenosyltransferase